MNLPDLINSQARNLVLLAIQYAAAHGERVDLVLDRVEISRWSITIRMRPRPRVI